MEQKTTIVMVSYNSAHLLEERLYEYADRPVVIVDNASSDETLELVSRSFPDVRIIASKVNSGYGRAANQAFEHVETPYALLVNPDAQITKDAISSLESEVLELAGNWLFVAPNTGVIPDSRRRVSASLEEIEVASGAALFFHVDRFRELRGFDPNIFLFFEETDLCRRAVEAGVKMYYAGDIPVEHELGTSTHSTMELEYLRKWHYNWSSLYFCRKHHLWARYFGTIWRNLIVAAIKSMTASKSERRYVMCHARYHSARRFLLGRAAFLPSGEPFRESILSDLENRSVSD